MQAFQRRLLQQNQSMPDVVGIGVRMGGQNVFNAGGQTACPAFGFGGVVGWNALFHAGSASLNNFSKLVTGIPRMKRHFHPPQPLTGALLDWPREASAAGAGFGPCPRGETFKTTAHAKFSGFDGPDSLMGVRSMQKPSPQGHGSSVTIGSMGR